MSAQALPRSPGRESGEIHNAPVPKRRMLLTLSLGTRENSLRGSYVVQPVLLSSVVFRELQHVALALREDPADLISTKDSRDGLEVVIGRRHAVFAVNGDTFPKRSPSRLHKSGDGRTQVMVPSKVRYGHHDPKSAG